MTNEDRDANASSSQKLKTGLRFFLIDNRKTKDLRESNSSTTINFLYEKKNIMAINARL